MTIGRRRADSPQEDELMSRLYQQVTEQQAARFAAGHDMAAGLDRFRAWLAEHTEEQQADVQAARAAVPGFTVDISQNPYLPLGGHKVSAIVTLTANKELPDVALQVWTQPKVTVRFVKEVFPAIVELAGGRLPPHRYFYRTRGWAPGESRAYLVALSVSPAGIHPTGLAARVLLVARSAGGEQVLGEGEIGVAWTDDETLSARIDPQVAYYTRQALAEAIHDGLRAAERADVRGRREATWCLGRAVVLAHELGDEETLRLLARVFDVEDEAAGAVRLKKKVDAADSIALRDRFPKTVPSSRDRLRTMDTRAGKQGITAPARPGNNGPHQR